MKKFILIYKRLSALLFICCFSTVGSAYAKAPDWNHEIIYHVFQRSFYDSNGDRNGDINGVIQKLDYLKELGITTILFTPLYESDFYHNYFARDYEKIDPEYGTMDDYLSLIRAIHRNGMKFIMDMETQYAQNGNIWFDDSFKNPSSAYSGFIYYSDSLNRYPEQFFIPSGSDLVFSKAWPDQKLNIVYLNLNSQKVKDWTTKFYAHWVDPNSDGKFDDGVDGFRIDHMMDDLDNKGKFTQMFTDFWNPVFKYCKTINPKLFVVGEQSNWAEYGDDMIVKSGIDASFGFPIQFAIAGTPEFFVRNSADSSLRYSLNAADYFNNIRSQILIQRNASIPNSAGLTLPPENIGKVQNSGFEGALGYHGDAGDFHYDLGINGSYSKNKIVFWDETPGVPTYQQSTGRPMGSTLYYQAIGIFKDQAQIDATPHWAGAQAGDVIFKDVNGDKVIDGLDRVMNDKNDMPRFIGGLTAAVRYKDFDLSLLFQGATGAVQYVRAESGEIGNYYKLYADNRWTPENTNSAYPRAWNRDQEYWGSQANTFWLQNMNYLRLKNFEVGYNLPAALDKKLGIGTLRVYLNGQNLFTFSKEKLIDPEQTAGTAYPLQRVVNGGITLTF